MGGASGGVAGVAEATSGGVLSSPCFDQNAAAAAAMAASALLLTSPISATGCSGVSGATGTGGLAGACGAATGDAAGAAKAGAGASGVAGVSGAKNADVAGAAKAGAGAAKAGAVRQRRVPVRARASGRAWVAQGMPEGLSLWSLQEGVRGLRRDGCGRRGGREARWAAAPAPFAREAPSAVRVWPEWRL